MVFNVTYSLQFLEAILTIDLRTEFYTANSLDITERVLSQMKVAICSDYLRPWLEFVVKVLFVQQFPMLGETTLRNVYLMFNFLIFYTSFVVTDSYIGVFGVSSLY